MTDMNENELQPGDLIRVSTDVRKLPGWADEINDVCVFIRVEEESFLNDWAGGIMVFWKNKIRGIVPSFPGRTIEKIA